MSANLTIAAKSRHYDKNTDTKVDGHVTLCYMPADTITSKLDSGYFTGLQNDAVIDRVVYWPGPNLTVALLSECNHLYDAQEYLTSLGYTYGRVFLPHITLSSDDQTSQFSHLVGESVELEYFTMRLHAQK